MLIAQSSTIAVGDAELAKWAIISAASVTAIFLVGFCVVAWASFSKDNKVASEYLAKIFTAGEALRLITVLVVVLAASILSLAGKTSEGVLALLSGVAGYVLGGINARIKEPPTPNHNSAGSQSQTSSALENS